MSTRRTASKGAPQPTDVVQWRRERLTAAGFADGLAAELAQSREIDLHRVLDLIDQGCPPPLAARILAPLDDSTRSERP